ncbi:MAG: CRISPR-associated endonuclease Cas2 [Patescibacteria group bacterium]
MNNKGLVSKIALGLLATGGVVAVLALSPGIGLVLKAIDPNPRKATEKLKRAFDRLAKDGDVEAIPGRERRYRLTSAGGRKLARLQFKDYSLSKQKHAWDRKWRVVCFDIPETDQYVRRLFQGKLSELGFYRLQNSVFVYPYPCVELLKLSNKAFELEKHVRLIVADSIDNQARLKHFFHLKP